MEPQGAFYCFKMGVDRPRFLGSSFYSLSVGIPEARSDLPVSHNFGAFNINIDPNGKRSFAVFNSIAENPDRKSLLRTHTIQFFVK
jgi:hypothetical protein